MPVYIFHRAEGCYPVQLSDDEAAKRNAECNPGTLQVTTLSERIVWQRITH